MDKDRVRYIWTGGDNVIIRPARGQGLDGLEFVHMLGPTGSRTFYDIQSKMSGLVSSDYEDNIQRLCDVFYTPRKALLLKERVWNTKLR